MKYLLIVLAIVGGVYFVVICTGDWVTELKASQSTPIERLAKIDSYISGERK